LVQSPQRSFQQKSLFGFEFSPIPLREEAKQNKPVTEKVKDVKDDENQSKVEKAVQVQKEINEETLDLPTPPKTEKKTIWQKIKHELHHYWVGTKLLAVDFKISARLVKQVLQGKELTRRERRQVLILYYYYTFFKKILTFFFKKKLQKSFFVQHQIYFV